MSLDNQFKKPCKKWGGVFKCLKISIYLFLLFSFPVSAFDFVSSKGEKRISINKNIFISSSSNYSSSLNKRLSFNKCIKKNKYQEIINREALLHNVDKKLITAVISAESCFNPKAVSPKGAQGLMQLMPFTAKRFGVDNSFNPSQNISGGVKYLKFLIKLFHGDLKLAVAAYNAGEGAVRRYGGIPPYKETRLYVKKVMKLMGGSKKRNLISLNNPIVKEKVVQSSKCHSNSKLRDYTFAVYYGKYIKRYYLLKQNETLLQVSRKVGLSLELIMKLNNFSDNKRPSSSIKNILLSKCKTA